MKYKLIGIVLLTLIAISGCIKVQPDDCPECEQCEVCPTPACQVCPEEKAEVDVIATEWAINEMDESEIWVSTVVYNYGNREARNTFVECRLYDEDMVYIKTAGSENVGHIGSQSYAEKIINIPNTNLYDDVYYIMGCFVKSCENCRILYKSIPDLKEVWG